MGKKEKVKPIAGNKAAREGEAIKSQSERLDKQYQFDIDIEGELHHYDWHAVFQTGRVAQLDKDAADKSQTSLHAMVFAMAKCTNSVTIFETDKKSMYDIIKEETGLPIEQVVRDAFSLVLSGWKNYGIKPKECENVAEMKKAKKEAIDAAKPVADTLPKELTERFHSLEALYSKASDEQRTSILDALDADIAKYVDALGAVLPVKPVKDEQPAKKAGKA